MQVGVNDYHEKTLGTQFELQLHKKVFRFKYTNFDGLALHLQNNTKTLRSYFGNVCNNGQFLNLTIYQDSDSRGKHIQICFHDFKVP